MQDGRIFFCNCTSFNMLAIRAQICQQILVTKSEGKRVLEDLSIMRRVESCGDILVAGSLKRENELHFP
jgi:hypothetical protein